MGDNNILNLLIKNNAISIQQTSNNWKEALEICFKPLVNKKIIDSSYIQSVINATNKYGPYYILTDYLAMPHSQNENNVFEIGFSLVTLTKPIYFENDDRPVSILVGLAAPNADIHVSIAIPQVAIIFSDENNIEKIINSTTEKEIIDIIKKILKESR